MILRTLRSTPTLLISAFVAASPLFFSPAFAKTEKGAAPAQGGKPAPAAGASRTGKPAVKAGWVEETLPVPTFGKANIYRPDPIEKTRGVVLFVSGDGGWNLGVVDMARRTANRSLVVGLSMRVWQKAAEKDPNHCWYPAGELESIAQMIEKHYGLPRYLPPILVGYSSGATMVYAAIVQAPPESFAGAVSLGFCPDMEVARPFCPKGEWKPTYEPKKHRSLLPAKADLPQRENGSARWIALQGDVDRVCDPNSTDKYVAQVPAGKVVDLAKVGHGFSVPRNWGTAYDESVDSFLDPVGAFENLPKPAPSAAPAAAAQIALEALELPLEVHWVEGARAAVIFLSGDGGWAEIDRRVTGRLAERGIAIVGWNALKYFWSAKTPDSFRSDLARVVGAIPADVRVFAGGYSFGAEVMPVAADPNGAPEALARIAGLVLLGPGLYATFEVSPLDWIRTSDKPTAHAVRPAVERAGRPAICLEDADHADSGCPDESQGEITRVVLPGGHHFSGDYEGIANRIADFIDGSLAKGAGPAGSLR